MKTENAAVLNAGSAEAAAEVVAMFKAEGRSVIVNVMHKGQVAGRLCWDAIKAVAEFVWNGVVYVWDRIVDLGKWIARVIGGAYNGAKAQA